MRVLLSAYACEPGKGSEPGVGWNWAVELARAGSEVWVVTRANNEPTINKALAELDCRDRLHFVYHDLGPLGRRIKRLPLGITWYYARWCKSVRSLAKQLHQQHRFDAAQHITFGVFRTPASLGDLGIPTVFGPLGGAERAPKLLERGFPWRGRLLDGLRVTANRMAFFNPALRRSLATASLVLAKTPETAEAVERLGAKRVQCHLEIGIDQRLVLENPPARAAGPGLKALFVGRFVYWKGGALALRAFARFASMHPEATLTLVGKGPDEQSWRELAEGLGIAPKLRWISWVTQQELRTIYAEHDVFLFPSLHDSSGNVVLEALANALPVVCLDVGGPAQIVNPQCAMVVDTTAATEDAVIARLAAALDQLARDAEQRRQMSSAALLRARSMSWAAAVRRIWGDPALWRSGAMEITETCSDAAEV